MQSGLGMAPPPRSMTGSMPAGRSQPPSAPRSAPPPIPGARPQSMPPLPGQGYNGGLGASTGAQLSIIYQGEKVAVAKDRFVIGRGKQSSDLTLKDPNVSRQHAMIEYQNGVYFMVDMGSTNGVEYNGQRIARKQIAEGDVFRICDHDLRFTYR
jgi:pSer/pThr/pTyr-binding forkhead associated (FHA) protein